MKKLLSTDKIAVYSCYAIFFLGWQVVSSQHSLLQVIFPPPTLLVKSVLANRDLLWQSIGVSLSEAILGLLIAALSAMIIAVIFDWIPFAKKLFMPLFIAQQAAPLLAIAPLITLWFGFGYSTKVAMVALVCFFPILLAFMQALHQSDGDYINLLKSYGASSWQLFILLKLPLALPAFFAGLKVAASYAVGAAITAEWIGAQQGLGVVLLRSRKAYDYSLLLSTVIIIIILSLMVFQLVKIVEKTMLQKFHL